MSPHIEEELVILLVSKGNVQCTLFHEHTMLVDKSKTVIPEPRILSKPIQHYFQRQIYKLECKYILIFLVLSVILFVCLFCYVQLTMCWYQKMTFKLGIYEFQQNTWSSFVDNINETTKLMTINVIFLYKYIHV